MIRVCESNHCKYLKSKVGSLFNKLSKLTRSQWDLKYKTLSTIYRGVFIPVVTYAAAGWVDLCTVKDKKVLRVVQREVLIAHTSAYRTASWESFCVVAEQTPIDLFLDERRILYEVRKGKDIEVNGTVIGKDTEDVKKIIRRLLALMRVCVAWYQPVGCAA